MRYIDRIQKGARFAGLFALGAFFSVAGLGERDTAGKVIPNALLNVGFLCEDPQAKAETATENSGVFVSCSGFLE